jgi:hypothetical protein
VVAAAAAGALLAVRDVVGGGEPGAWAMWMGFVGLVIWEVTT